MCPKRVDNFHIIFTKFRLDVALDLETAITKKYSGSYFYEEMKGMADATGLDEKVRNIEELIFQSFSCKSFICP